MAQRVGLSSIGIKPETTLMLLRASSRVRATGATPPGASIASGPSSGSPSSVTPITRAEGGVQTAAAITRKTFAPGMWLGRNPFSLPFAGARVTVRDSATGATPFIRFDTADAETLAARLAADRVGSGAMTDDAGFLFNEAAPANENLAWWERWALRRMFGNDTLEFRGRSDESNGNGLGLGRIMSGAGDALGLDATRGNGLGLGRTERGNGNGGNAGGGVGNSGGGNGGSSAAGGVGNSGGNGSNAGGAASSGSGATGGANAGGSVSGGSSAGSGASAPSPSTSGSVDASEPASGSASPSVTIPTGRRGTSTRELRRWFASEEGTAAIQAGDRLATSLLQALNANDRAALRALTRSAGRR